MNPIGTNCSLIWICNWPTASFNFKSSQKTGLFKMAAPGKKSKKKWKVVDLKVENIRAKKTAGSGEINMRLHDHDDYGGRRSDEVVLPTAPRSSRVAEEDAKVPTSGPFYAYISNLAYELNEEELVDYFRHLNVNVKTVNLPKNDQSFKSRGFAHAEFEDRESLIKVLHCSHSDLKGRRMRVELAQNDGRSGMRGGMRSNMNEPDYISQDWRAGGGRRDNDDDGYKSRRNYGDSGFGRRDGDRRGGFDRDQRGGGGGFSRDEERDWTRDSNTSWRDRGNNDRDRDRGGDRDRRGGGGGFGSRGFDDRRGGDRDRDDRRGGGELSWKRDTMPSSQEPSEGREEPRARPKLDLKPRSAPVSKEEGGGGGGGGGGEKASIFGAAKPVDTASRERQIEERLEKQTALIEDPPRRKGPESWERVRDRYRDSDMERGYNVDGDWDEHRSDDGDYQDEKGSEREEERGGRQALAPAPPPSTNAWAARAAMAANNASQHSADNGRTSPTVSDEESKSGGGSPPQDSDAASRKYQPPHGRRPLPPSDDRNRSGGPQSNSGRAPASAIGQKTTNHSKAPAQAPASARPREPRKDDKDEAVRVPKFQEQKPPNFVGSNKYAFLEEANEATAN